MRTLTQIMLVAAGSSLGGLTRWGVAVWFGRWFGPSFPWATMFINITGSLFLGWFLTIANERWLAGGVSAQRLNDFNLLVAVGFTGAYTTFSTFEYEAHSLFGRGNSFAAAAYVALSVFLGLLAVRLGVVLARLG